MRVPWLRLSSCVVLDDLDDAYWFGILSYYLIFLNDLSMIGTIPYL
jgi:hypothetical protein